MDLVTMHLSSVPLRRKLKNEVTVEMKRYQLPYVRGFTESLMGIEDIDCRWYLTQLCVK